MCDKQLWLFPPTKEEIAKRKEFDLQERLRVRLFKRMNAARGCKRVYGGVKYVETTQNESFGF